MSKQRRKSASVDGTKWNIYENNLLEEYHIRYGGYGGCRVSRKLSSISR